MAQSFCKVCRDAGKSSSVFNSHFTKDRQGNTICPTLLNQECRWCREKGHTVKYCQKLAEKNAREQVKEKEQERPSHQVHDRRVQQKKQEKQENPQNHGRFALLMDDDEPASAGAEKEAPVEHFPELTGNWARVVASQPAKPTFASMVAKPLPSPATPRAELRTQLEAAGFKFLEAKKPAPAAASRLPSSEEIAAIMNHRSALPKNWADAYDSEDDEELTQYERDMAAIENFTDRCRD